MIATGARLGLPVYTLGLGPRKRSRAGPPPPGRLDPRSVLSARNADQLRAIYETIAERIGSSYTLVYQSERKLPDGTLRPVRIFYRGSRRGRRDGRCSSRVWSCRREGGAALSCALASGGRALLCCLQRSTGHAAMGAAILQSEGIVRPDRGCDSMVLAFHRWENPMSPGPLKESCPWNCSGKQGISRWAAGSS